jgi:hypothetical protein
MPTMTQTVKFPVVLGLLANVLCILPASVDAQQQPAPGAPGYTRIQGQDGGALPLPAINTLRALTDHREEMRKLIEGISTYARQQKNGFMVVARDAEELIIKRDLQDDKIVSPARTFMRSMTVSFLATRQSDRHHRRKSRTDYWPILTAPGNQA